jgi:hypothetical protein
VSAHGYSIATLFTGETMMRRACSLALVCLVLAGPGLASGLTDPVVAPDVIAAEATAASPAKLDGLITAIFTILLILNLAGALN